MASQLQKFLRSVFQRIGTSTITSPLEMSESRSDRLLKNHADINDSLTSDIQLPSASGDMEGHQLSHQVNTAEAAHAGKGNQNLPSAVIPGYEDFDKVAGAVAGAGGDIAGGGVAGGAGVVYIAQYFARQPDDLTVNDYTHLN